MSFDFDNDEYTAPKNESLPIAQVFNPYLSKKTRALQPYGFGITKDNAEQVDFQPDDNWSLIDYTFESGDTNPIYITTTPRLAIIHRSKVLAEVRRGHEDEGKVVEVPPGEWDRAKYKVLQRHIIFFVSKNKKLLHSVPLLFTPKGAAWGTFNTHYANREKGRLIGGFCQELQEIYTQSKNQKGRKMNELFFAHGIFSCKLKDEERGEGTNTALVCATAAHEIPTITNWQNFLIESDSQESKIVLTAFEEYKDYFASTTLSSEEFNEIGSISEQEIKYLESGSASCEFLLTYYRSNERFQLFCKAENGLAQKAANAEANLDYRIKGIKQGGIVAVKSLESEIDF